MGLKDFFIDLKKFTWYILTEPFRQLWEGLKIVGKKIDIITRMKVWMGVSIILATLSALAHNREAALAFIACFLIILIIHEWTRGFFRKRWKDKEFNRLEKELKQSKEGEVLK